MAMVRDRVIVFNTTFDFIAAPCLLHHILLINVVVEIVDNGLQMNEVVLYL
jgi:hypothetical protein